ncbi:MAG: ribonuclease H-like domain-containing protein [Phycisphaerae bacterium]
MLTHTFLHIPGVGAATEQRLWASGLDHWDRIERGGWPAGLSAGLRARLIEALAESRWALEAGEAGFFASQLPPGQHWRLYREFRGRTGFVDIETTGLDPRDSYVTTIAVFDGRGVRSYVHGQNLEEFRQDVRQFALLVTYNGKAFDVPFLRHRLAGLQLDQPHIDLRYFLRWLGYTGGLKGCERKMGLSRPAGLEQIDGSMAVRLWNRHLRGDERALPTLLRYNAEDAVNLRWLMETGYNMAVRRLPIRVEPLAVEPRPELPSSLDTALIAELQGSAFDI